MRKMLVIAGLLLPASAFAALDNRGGANSVDSATGGGLFGRIINRRPTPNESREVAQFGPPRQTNTQYPQQPAPPMPQQTAPQSGQPGAQPTAQTPRAAESSGENTPAPRRPRRTPKPETDSDEGSSSKKPAADSTDLDQMASKIEKEKQTSKLESDLAKSADEATTIVAGFLRSANDGVYSKAATYLTPELQKYFESEMSAVNGGLKTVLDQLTRNGDIRSVTYANATVRGEGAVVDAELTYGAGSPEKKLFDLLKTKTGWKIVLSVGSHKSADAPARPASTMSSAPSQPAPSAPPPPPAPTPTPQVSPTATDAASTGAAATR